MRPRKWNETQLIKAVKESYSYRQVLRVLGLIPAGGNYEQLKKYIKETGLETHHFKGKGWNRGLKRIGEFRIPLSHILVRNSLFQSHKLKQRLFASNLKPMRCEKCSWAKYSLGGNLPLELHHKNGDRHDNRLNNLLILCPNCHSLEPNYRGRNIKKARVV